HLGGISALATSCFALAYSEVLAASRRHLESCKALDLVTPAVIRSTGAFWSSGQASTQQRPSCATLPTSQHKKQLTYLYESTIKQSTEHSGEPRRPAQAYDPINISTRFAVSSSACRAWIKPDQVLRIWRCASGRYRNMRSLASGQWIAGKLPGLSARLR